jgi:hypothetical protein
MKLAKLCWILVLLLITVPYVLLGLAGSIWLWQERMLWWWAAAACAGTLLGWRLAVWLRGKRPAVVAGVSPGDTWTPLGLQAWEDVEVVARRVQAEDDVQLDRIEPLAELVREVLQTVARRFHPSSDQPELEIPVPHVLQIVELVARDLREAFSEHVPGAHILTLNDFRRLGRLAGFARRFYFLYRVISFGFSPVSALLREIRDAAAGELAQASGGELKGWALGFCVRKAGYYAIQLYSGQLELSRVEFEGYRTARSKRLTDRAETDRQRMAGEPLRILVLGQVKSGKSSLINALFGETRAAVDVIPRTEHVDPYLLDREGVPRALILDTAGYEEGAGGGDPFPELGDQILECDLVLLVCSALSAARAPDRRLLHAVRTRYQTETSRLMPPLVVVVTHVDLLRPVHQWEPPYNLGRPDCPKAEHIAGLVLAVTQDLALGPDQPVVPVCLKPGMEYNVEEGVAAAIVHTVPEAQRVKCLRCLRTAHGEEYWRKLWRQAVNAGRIALRFGGKRPGPGDEPG